MVLIVLIVFVANSYLGSIKINIDGKYYILFLLINSQN
jgi:hypothetical protein